MSKVFSAAVKTLLIISKCLPRNESNYETGIARSSQELLNDIVEHLDILLMETLIDATDIERFDLVKRDLRELLTILTKEISSLKNEVGTLKAQLSRLEIMETTRTSSKWETSQLN